MARAIICLLLVVLSTGKVMSQSYRESQEAFLEAEYFLMFEDYSDALPYYMRLLDEYPDNFNLTYKVGLCYLNIQGKKNLAVDYLESAARNSAATYKEGSLSQSTAPYEAWYYLGVAYRINFNFDKAKDAFRRYRETLLADDTENLLFLDHQIEVCDNARELMKNPVKFSEENLGEQFNDSYSNFNPVISADGKTFAYMTSLKFYDAVFFSRMEKEKWTSPVNITPDIQSDGDLYISSLSADGKMLFLSKDDDNNSDIYLSRYDGTKWSVAEKMSKNINTKYWESHATISADGKSLIFASNRPGGLGGLDLYISYLDQNGSWGPAVNLGPEINTPFNEDRAFISSDGKAIYFSSQGHFNMGGYDIFKSTLSTDKRWSKPVNMGYPFNTPDDNIFYMPIDAKKGYISLYREGTGLGKEDIYIVTFK
ncbi:MAG: tetratricopeptide repeat protein [Bacteroidales bacterium]